MNSKAKRATNFLQTNIAYKQLWEQGFQGLLFQLLAIRIRSQLQKIIYDGTNNYVKISRTTTISCRFNTFKL